DSHLKTKCKTRVLVGVFYCQKCLEEKKDIKEWCGHEYYQDRPDWTKLGKWEMVKGINSPQK
ncbi:MAG: hypothetical protein LIP01_05955, partial [Tannerellaceae bacterium]|nr:hypothetical protein [Tannerellaceae bacterium]